MRRIILSSVSVIAICFAVALLLTPPRNPAAVDNLSTVLKEQAQRSGGKLRIVDTSHHAVFYQNMSELIKDSEAIIVGQTVHNRCRLTSDGQSVTTNYDVAVREVLRGDLNAGETITIG